jgi:5-methylcytosine-specific restriction endonuclease McrA
VKYRPSAALPNLPIGQRLKHRMPTADEKRALHVRDGYHCRFCGIPVIRKEVRERIRAAYPQALRWGKRNTEAHTAFQAMWSQYDHLIPCARGGTTELSNLVVTCAPCNPARMNYSPEEVGLIDPRTSEPVRSGWDGLERFR